MSTFAPQNPPDWQTDFTQLAASTAGVETGEPLALQLNGGQLEPLRLDTSGNWSTNRATWRDLTSRWASVTDGLRADHLAALRRLYQGATSGAVYLKKLGPEAGRALVEAAALGVSIFTDPTHTQLLPIYTEAAQPRLQIKEADNQGALDVTVTLLVGQRAVPSGHVQLLPGNWAAWVASVPALVCLQQWAASPGIEGLGQALLEKRKWHISAVEAPQFWVQHYERLSQLRLFCPEDLEKLSVPTFGLPNLRVEFSLHPDNPHSISSTWEVTRRASHGQDWKQEFNVSQADAQLRSYAKRVAGAAGIKSNNWEGFFTQNYPLWELPGLRKLPEKLAGLGVEVSFSADLESTQIYDALSELQLTLVDSPQADPHAAGEQDLASWFDLHLQAKVGTQELDSDALLGALKRNERWFEFCPGQWLDLYEHDLRNLAGLLSAAGEISAPGGNAQTPTHKLPTGVAARLSLLQTGLVSQLAQIADLKTSPRWRERVTALAQGSTLEPTKLSGANWRDYQLFGVQWLTARAQVGLGGILADDMGLGKTWQVLGTIATLKEHDQLHGAVLVVMPSSLLATWQQMAQQWFTGLKVAAQSTTFARSGENLEQKIVQSDVLLTTYTLLRLEPELYQSHHWGGLVIDEAQFVKNPQTGAYQALAQIESAWRFALSGTPVENSLLDLWALTNLVTPGLLPSQKVFERRWMGPGNVQDRLSLRQRISPFLLRRTKESVAKELPKKTEQVITLQLESEHRAIYQAYTAKVLQSLGQEENRMHILAALTRARQLALSPQIIDAKSDIEGAKTKWLRHTVPQLAKQGHSVLIFSQFTTYLAQLRKMFDELDLPYSYLDGATTNRQNVIDQFRSGQTQVFLISLKAGGFGLNLTEADYVFLCDPWWNPAAEAQAVDRAHRLGQEKPVNVYRLIAAGTVEERVMQLQKSKKDLAAQALAGQENPQTGPTLSLHQLKELLQD